MESRSPLTLRLRAPLPWRAAEAPEPARREGSEDLAAYDWDALFVTGEDGPRLREGPQVREDPQVREGPQVRGALPAPAFTGVEAKGGEAADLVLEAGDWAFLQPARAPADEAELLELAESFARDLWWEGTPCEGPLFVRCVFEDGRRATQLWRRVRDRSGE